MITPREVSVLQGLVLSLASSIGVARVNPMLHERLSYLYLRNLHLRLCVFPIRDLRCCFLLFCYCFHVLVHYASICRLSIGSKLIVSLSAATGGLPWIAILLNLVKSSVRSLLPGGFIARRKTMLE